MANHYRVLLAAVSPNREVLHRFLGGLLIDGWYAHALVNNINSDPNDITSEVKAWGGYLFSDLRIMVDGSSFKSCDCDLPDFGSTDCREQLSFMMGTESYPGFEAPLPGEEIVLVMGESRCGPPSGWAETAIDKHYDAGLRLFVMSYDLCEAADTETIRPFIFYSAPEDVHEMKLSKHCVGIELEEEPIDTKAA